MEPSLPPPTTTTTTSAAAEADGPVSDGLQNQLRSPPSSIEPPIRLLCIGAHRTLALRLMSQLKPYYTYCAILSLVEPKRTYSLENLDLVLDALHPPPAGVIVGGGSSDEEAQEMARLVATKKTENGMPMEFVRVPVGTFENSGPEGLLRKIKELLYEKFGREC